MNSLDVLLVSMPFAPVTLPHAAIGVLCGAARRSGLSARATYPSFRFADHLGFALYTSLAENYIVRQVAYHDFPGEWLFASWMDPARPSVLADNSDDLVLSPDAERLLPEGNKLEILKDRLRRVRVIARDFVHNEVESALRLRPAIIGCSSTFIQHAACLTFLRAVKELEPSTITMLGGANCEGEMGFETAIQFPWVDYTFSGEADETFPALCRRLLDKTPVRLANLPYGVYTREKAESQGSASEHPRYEVAVVENMKSASQPDFDDYFRERDQSAMRDWVRICSVEGARGCQKGERSICTFCALNGQRVGYRRKGDEDFWTEVVDLSERHNVEVFALTDNILGVESFDGWLKRAAKSRQTAFILEVRSTLNEDQVRALAAAQVCQVQPGIESLDDHLLGLMRKGNSVVRNVAFLKYLREQSIGSWWNLLYQIPGEEEADYVRQAELFPLLHHLPPPMNFSKIRFSKFSRYERAPEEFGLELKPGEGFRVIYPGVSESSLQRLAYCFIDLGLKSSSSEYVNGAKRVMFEKAAEWRALYSSIGADQRGSPPVLCMQELNGLIKIKDTRSCAVHPFFLLDELESAVYRQIRAPNTKLRIREALRDEAALKPLSGRVEECLDTFLRYKLMIQRKDLYLALATYRPLPISSTQRRGFEYLRRMTESISPAAFQEDVKRLFASQ